MNKILLLSPKYIRLLVLVIALIAGYSAEGQTPGLILKPATGAGAAILDPNRDGYVSKTTGDVQLGFHTNDVTESEIPFVAIVKPDPLGDILRGPQGGFTEIVGTDAAGNNAILTYTDGINLYVRFRLSSYAPNSKSYSLLIDTDQKFGFTGPDADPDARAGNPGFEVEIVLRTNFYVDVYNVNGPSLVQEGTGYSYETNCQKSIALSAAGDDPDYFYDFYLPLPSLISSSTPLRYVAVTGMSPHPAMGSNSASDVGGVTPKDVSLDQAFIELIDIQTPTVPGQEVLDRSDCPAITGPVSSGATSVSGTSGDNGATIRLYVNDVEVKSTTVSGGSWTISGLTPLTGGASIKATAQALGKGESSSTCNLTFVGSSCSLLPVVVSIDNGDKGGRVTNVASYPAGTVFTLYSASTNSEFSDSRDNNPYTISQVDITRGTIDIGCGGTGNCLPDGSYYIVAQASGECASQKGFFCVGSAISASSTPVIDNTIPPLSSYITGTNGAAGAVMYIYANGTQIGSKILSTSGAWSVPVPSTSLCNTTLTARQIASSQCISATSAAVTIGSAVTSAPTINIDKCTSSITAVTGYSGESDGTIIQLYVDGVLRTETTLVSGGKWTINNLSAITAGQTITARATNGSACKTISGYSAPVTLTGTTLLTGAYSIPSTVAEGASSVSVVVTGISGTYTLNLYIDKDKIGSQSFTGSGTVVVPVTYASDIYTGGELQVSLTEGSKCESALSEVLKTVECNIPSFTSVVISTPLNNKCVTTSGTISVTNSQTGVIYTPVNAAGVVKGYSTLGTGNTISLKTYAFPTSGPATFYVKAQRIVPSGTCEATSTTSVSFNAFDSPRFTTHPASMIVCNGESATLTASWTGMGPYNVQWQYNDGSGFIDLTNGGIYSETKATGITATSATLTISNVTGLDNYTFRCMITDTSVPTDCQSTTSNTSTLSVPIVTIPNALVTNATLGNNGSINITVSGGTGPYLFDWHHLNGSGTFGEMEDLTGLSEGTYTVTVKDANGCTYQQTFMVGGVNSINLTLNSKTDVSCYGSNDGSFTVSAAAGTGPYTYSIDHFATPQASGTFSGLSPGSYNVQARDAGSKTSNTVVVTITQPFEMAVYAAVSNPSVSLNDGSIHVTVIGGTSTFNYELFKGGTSIRTFTNKGDTVRFINLSEGTYSIVVKDVNNCTASKSNVVLVNPDVVVINCTHKAAHSFNSIGLEIPTYYHYDGNYDYFNNNPWVENNDNNNRIQLNKQALGFGLIPADTQSGNNAVKLSGNPSISRTVDLTGVNLSSVKIEYKFSVDVPSGNDDYGVRLFVNNAAYPAAFHVQNSSQGINGSVSLTSTSTNVALVNGINTFRFEMYQVSSNKYEAESNVLIDDFSVSFTKPMNVGVSASPSTCDNGRTFLSVSGGYPPYTYHWSKGGDPDFVSTDKNLYNLSPGIYKVIVSDNRNCSSSQILVEVKSVAFSATATSTHPDCIGGGSNGTVTATLSPGALGYGGPYTYQLIKGASEIIPAVVSATTSKTFTGLTAGTYYVKVKQADGCFILTPTVTLILPEFTSGLVFTGGSSTICSGASTTIAVNITGGAAPYTVLLSNGQQITNYISGSDIAVSPLISTTYSVLSVTDASGCVSPSNTGTAVITVNPALPVGVSISASPAEAICLGTTVTFTATPSNAGANPTYTWKVGTNTVGSNSPTFITSSLVNGDAVTCIVTKDPEQTCMTGSPATSNSMVMSVPTPATAVAGTDVITCSTYGAVNITAGASADSYSNISWTSSGTGTFTNAGSLSLATYTPSSNDIAAGSVTLTLTANGNAPCGNAVSTKTLTITRGHYADFSYAGSPYCSNQANPSPTFRGEGEAGTFSSTPGLVFVSAASGQINLSASTAGTYMVTNTIAASGGCDIVTATTMVTILPDGSWTGAVDRNWNNAANWACNQLPTLVTNVTIASGLTNYPIVSTEPAGMAKDILIANGASVTVSGHSLQIAGNISNSGTLTATEGTIEMIGSVPQTIGANVFDTNTLLNLKINNASGVTLQGALNITGVVSPVMGNLNADGHLTLLSTATQTALVEGVGSGSISGNVNMQRYLPSSFGYKYFSSPFQWATVAELSQEVNLTEPFPTFYKYDEDHSRDSSNVTVYYSGWTKYTAVTNPLVPLYGYAANLGTGINPITVTMSGVVNNGDLQTTLYNHNRKYTKGFNLVGNPYPSPIDWDAAGWTKTNIDNAIYFFNAGNTDRYGGVYSSYVNGVASGNGNKVIAAMQGFFVHVSNGSYPVTATLGVTNSVRVNNLNPVFKTAMIDPRPTLRLKAGFEIKDAIEDAAVIYFDPLANIGFEQDMDALKLNNTDIQVPNIYTLSQDGSELSINGLPVASDSLFTIPVGITTFTPGWINLRAENVKDLLLFEEVILKDALTGQLHDLSVSPDVRFYLDKGQYDRRFSLLFSKVPVKGSTTVLEKLFTVVRSGNSVLVKVNLASNTKGNLRVTNILGQNLLRKEVFEKEAVEISQGTGVYIITLVSGKISMSEKILMRTDYE